MWFCCTSGSPKADSTPHSASSVPRSTPKSFSIRANSASFFFSASLPLMMRQSETRRLMYCQVSSVNSGWLRSSLKTLHVGFDAAHRPGSRSPPKCPWRARGHENGRAIASKPAGAAWRRTADEQRRRRARPRSQHGAARWRLRESARSLLQFSGAGRRRQNRRAGSAVSPVDLRQFWTASAGR